MKLIKAHFPSILGVLLLSLINLVFASASSPLTDSTLLAQRSESGRRSALAQSNIILPYQAPAARLPEGENGKLVLGGTYTLESGKTLNGDLVVAGGNVTLEVASEVHGNVLILGGMLDADGLVTGDILALGGNVHLGENASVEGSVNMLGGNLRREPGSIIEGEQGFSIPAPALPAFPGKLTSPTIDWGMSPVWKLFWILMRSFLWAAAAILITLFLPGATHRIGQAISGHPLVAGGLGCLTVMVAPIVLFIIGITIIGLPISLVGAMILLVAWCFGIIAAGYEVGRRLALAFKHEWARPVAAAVGVFLLTVVINSVNAVIPCIGWFLPFLVGLLGLGAVFLTRFGSKQYQNLPDGVSLTVTEPTRTSPPDEPTG